MREAAFRGSQLGEALQGVSAICGLVDSSWAGDEDRWVVRKAMGKRGGGGGGD